MMRSASRNVAVPDAPVDRCWLGSERSWTAALVTENMVTSPVLMPDSYTRESSAALAVLPEAEKRGHLIRAVSASAIGTTIEWYDFFLYGVAAATVFPQKFFPGSDPFYSTLASFSTLFVGFAARPLGAALFGHF